MILLSNITSVLQLVTGSTQITDVQTSWVDASGTTITPNDLNTIVSSATTTTIVPSPAVSTQRNIKFVCIRNTDATTAITITVQHFDGANTSALLKFSLLAQYSLFYEDADGWYVLDSNGARVVGASITTLTGSAPIVVTGSTAPNVSITAATDLAAGSMSAADKTKLDGITPGAAVASVGATAPATSTGGTTPVIGVQVSPGAATTVVGTTRNVNTTAPLGGGGALSADLTLTISAATDLAAGSMSAADKTKLDGITPGAAVASVGATAPATSTGGTTPVIGVQVSPGAATTVVGTTRNVNTTAPLGGGGALSADLTLTISAATDLAAGSMSAADKTKLDGITPGAAVASVGATAPATSTGGTTPVIGVQVSPGAATTVVGTTRNVNTTAPLGGGGPLSADLTLTIAAATDSAAGSMSGADKTKLDSMTAGAAVASVGVTAPIENTGTALAPVIAISAATTAAAGSMSATDKEKERLFIDPMADYGCKFDRRLTFDGATTGSTGIITSATMVFTAADVGKRIVLTGAGAAAAQYVGSILSLNSGTSVNVTPNTGTTVSAKGLQVHTDDLAAWTTLINDINSSTYPGAVIKMETPNGATAFGASSFTGSSGISSFLPTITKQIRISGYGGLFNSNAGNYWQEGGSCIAYVGTSNAPTAFGAVMTFAPVAGASNSNLKAVVLEHFWIDCRNGDQNEALKGISMQSCFAWEINDVFIMDPCAVGVEFLVISPGTAGALGEAKDCSRGSARQLSARLIDNPAAGAVTTPITTTTVIALSTAGQSLTVAANTLPASGYIWVQSNLGYPVLCNYTGGGGTTTLTGVTCSLQDTINAPSTVSGSNIVQAVPSNGCGFLLDGDLTANANLNHFDTCQLVLQTTPTWGPAAIEFRNSDSNEITNVVINGGNPAALAQPNRITKPGVRFMGSNTNATLAARNNVFKSGSAGAGGVSNMGILNTNANLSAQAGPNYWNDYQLGNGEAIPTVEGNSFFLWHPNGGFGPGTAGSPVQATAAGQAITAATATAIVGSVLPVPPQGFQIGTVFRWTIVASKTAAGVAARTFNIRVGTTGTATDAVVAAFTSALGTAAIDTAFIQIWYTITAIGATANGTAIFQLTHVLATTGWATTASQTVTGTMTAFNSTTAQLFISVSVTTGAAEVPTVLQCFCEVVKPANP